MPRLSSKKATVVLTVAFAMWQILWAFVTPAFRTPDEPMHYNSIMRVVAGGGWPDPGEAAMDASVMDAVHESGLLEDQARTFRPNARSELGGSIYRDRFDVPRYADRDVPAHEDRSVVRYLGVSAPGLRVGDQMTQHPPLYYLLGAGVVKAIGAQDWAWDRQILLLRIFSILLTLPLVPCVVYSARRLGAGRGGAFAGALALAVPQLPFITAGVTNDSLAIGAGSLVCAACTGAASGKATRKTVALAGVGLGIGLWSKATFMPMLAVVFLAFLASSGAWKRRLRSASLACGIGVLLGSGWWVRNLLRFGAMQPEGMARQHLGPGEEPLTFIRVAGQGLVESSWARLGWLEWVPPRPLVYLAFAVALLAVAAGITTPGNRLAKVLAVAYYPLAGSIVLWAAWKAYVEDGVITGVQGRYLFPGIVGVLAVAGVGLGSRRWRGVLLGAGMAFSLLTLGGWFLACYGTSAERWVHVVGVSPWLLAGAVLAGLASLAAAWCVPLRYSGPVAPPIVRKHRHDFH